MIDPELIKRLESEMAGLQELLTEAMDMVAETENRWKLAKDERDKAWQRFNAIHNALSALQQPDLTEAA